MERLPKTDRCWVYVMWEESRNDYYVRFTGELSACIGGHTVCVIPEHPLRLVFYREFDDTLAGMGYRIALSHLSRGSLEAIIARDNPDREDISYTLNIH